MSKSLLAVLVITVLSMSIASSPAHADTVQMTALEVTDLSVATAFVSWATDQQTTGNKIEITSTDSTWQVEDSYAGESYTHYVQIIGLQPSTEYTYKVISAGTQWDNDGEGYKFSTIGYIPPGASSIALFGELEDSWGSSIGRGLVRYWLYNEVDGASLPRAAIADASGEWSGNIGIMFNSTGTDRFPLNGNDQLIIEYVPNYWTSARDSLDMPTSTKILSTRSIQVTDPNAVEPGDLDGNGAINIFDVLEILKIISGKVTPDPGLSAIADMDTNGKIDVFDLLELLKKLRPAATVSS